MFLLTEIIGQYKNINTNVPRLKSDSRASCLLRLALMRNVVLMEVSLLFDNMTCVFIVT